MTPAAFAALVLASAMAIKLVTDLRVPFAPLRRWLRQADHVALAPEAEHPDDGPWVAVVGGVHSPAVSRYPLAAAQITTAHRVRAYCAELVECPWCSGGWASLTATAGWALHVGSWSPLWVWPAVWFVASSACVLVKAAEEQVG